MIDVLGFVSSVFKPVADTIDKVHTSDEERLKAQTEFAKVQSDFTVQVLGFHKDIALLNSKTIEIESKSNSWLIRNWRPGSMVIFVTLIVLNATGIIPELNENLWNIIAFGFGGYTIGRTVEKIVPQIMDKRSK